MERVHYRVRRPRHGRPYRSTSTPVSQPPTPPPRPRREGLGVVSRHTTDAWRALLAPDGTPPALPLQVAYVRRAVWRETGMTPSLRGLTIGQAERVLAAVGADPAPLWRAGRSARAINLATFTTKWLVIVLLCLEFLTVGRIAGVPFVLVVMATATVALARRQRRQAFEDRHYRRGSLPRPGSAEGPTAPAAPPATPPDGTARPAQGSPYDVETYLRRLSEDEP